jgi:hypothetical protein
MSIDNYQATQACIIFVVSYFFSIQIPLPWCGMTILRKSFNPSFGSGKGTPGLKRSKRTRIKPKDVWASCLESNNNKLFEKLTRMYIDEFQELLHDVSYLKIHPSIVSLSLSFENIILLVFIWLVKYPDYTFLAVTFGTSRTIVCEIINNIIPLLAAHFATFIPNRVESVMTSSLSENIVCVIDSTLHAIRKPPKNQHLHWNEHYKRHGMMTTLLVDFEGYITSFVTGALAVQHDATAAFYMKSFVNLLNGKFALGDPGYAGVPYVVSGYKTNQLTSPVRRLFDKTSRSEQVIVEHVNNFIKSCRCLSKRHQFAHTKDKHVLCVFIICGWYNWMKLYFGKFERNV